jgi:anti-anti-sigma factor
VIEVSLVGKWALVVLSGEFDVSNAAEIVAVAADLADDLVAEVTVDLSGVTFIGAAGITALVQAEDRVAAGGGRLAVVGATPTTLRAFDLAEVGAALTVVAPPDRSAGGDSQPVGPGARVPADGEADTGGRVSGADDELRRLLFEVSRLLLTESSVTGDLLVVVRAAVDLVPGCTGASVALVAHSESHTAAVSDAIAVEVDLVQHDRGGGPNLLAASTATRIRVATSDIDDRFDRFAAQLGIGAVMSAPVVVTGVTVGSVNFYASTRFAVGAEAMAGVVASQVAAALSKSEIYGAALALARQMQVRSAADRDANIAAGVLAGFEDCSLDQATRLLHSAAATAGESVAAAARRVIDHLAGSGPVPPGTGAAPVR